MNPIVIDWLIELIENPSPQNCNSLTNLSQTAYCCLGDLCEMGIKKNLAIETFLSSGRIRYVFKGTSSVELIPTKLAFHLGLATFAPSVQSIGDIKLRDFPMTISALNDSRVPKPLLGILLYYTFSKELFPQDLASFLEQDSSEYSKYFDTLISRHSDTVLQALKTLSLSNLYETF